MMMMMCDNQNLNFPPYCVISVVNNYIMMLVFKSKHNFFAVTTAGVFFKIIF